MNNLRPLFINLFGGYYEDFKISHQIVFNWNYMPFNS